MIERGPIDRCQCGEILEHRIYRSGASYWTSEFCWSCGYESTHVERLIEPAEIVSSDEVLAVHEALESGKPWRELSQ